MKAQVTVTANEATQTFNVNVADGLLAIDARKSAIQTLKRTMDEQGLRFAHNAKFHVYLK